MRWLSAIFITLVAFNVDAQSKNSFQEFQPFGSNYIARSGSVDPYEYGYPSCEECSVEPNVAFQLLFDEESGYIYDEIQTVELRTIGTESDATYGVSASGPWSGVAPGITYPLKPLTFHHASTLTPIPNTSPGTGDFTLELVMALNKGDSFRRNLTFASYGAVGGLVLWGHPVGYYDPINPADGESIRLTTISTDNTTVDWNVDTSSYDIWDGNPHKYRWVFDRTDGKQYLYIDGADFSDGGGDISALAGKSIPINGWEYGEVGIATGATMYEARLSLNSTNNSGGPSVTVVQPSAPTSMAASASSTTQIDLSWGNPGDNVIEVQRCDDVLANSWETIETTSAGATTYDDTGRTSGEVYKYRTRAKNGAMLSEWSDVVTEQAQWASDFDYGYPAYGSSESDVLLQWTFEDSGPFVDEVSSVSLSALGDVTSGVTNSGNWADMSPGIAMDTSTSRIASVTSGLCDLGSGDFVIEITASIPFDLTRNYAAFIVTGGPTYGNTGILFYPVYGGGKSARFEARATDGTQTFASMTTDVDPRDGQIHKWRLVGSVGGDVAMYLDGEDLGDFDLSALSGKTIGSSQLYIGGFGSATFGSVGTFYEVRVTVGNDTNNSGGPGGG